MSTDISRRVTLAWIATAAVSAQTFLATGTAEAQDVATGAWQDIVLPPVTGSGYGQDPNLTKLVVPWPLTLDSHQREILRVAADLMLPADAHSPSGGTLHLDAFVDEWVSAPYPQQQGDRPFIVSGLAWLDREALHRFNLDFVQASDAQRREIFDLVAFRGRVAPGYGRPAQFFRRLRGLMLSGFYSRPEGIADIGYLGNNPTLGPWPGPTAEALAHLNAQLVKLGLKPVM